jgi:hypothetical protein
VPCVDGTDRPYLSLDAAASTGALPAVANAVHGFLPWYSSVHRGAGYKSRRATDAYEDARGAALAFAGRTPADDVAIICRKTTEAKQPPRLQARAPAGLLALDTVDLTGGEVRHPASAAAPGSE